MKKADIIEAVLERLRADLALHARAAANARAEATDEQSKAENKYDTRGLEASYLARGQSRQASEIRSAIEHFETLPTSPPAKNAAVSVGSLVKLRHGKSVEYYLIGPRAGGLDVTVDGLEITVLTPQSPLGQQLMGLQVGATLPINPGQGSSGRKIAAIE